jgi:hypothetical protein
MRSEERRGSGRRDSNSRHRPWEGRALPTELLPLGKPDFSTAFSQFLAHRPDHHHQLGKARCGALDSRAVEDFDGIGFVEPHPTAIPWLQVELLAEPRLEHQQLPRQTVSDALVYCRCRLEVKPQLETAGVRVPPGLEMQARVVEVPLRLTRADPVADALQGGW